MAPEDPEKLKNLQDVMEKMRKSFTKKVDEVENVNDARNELNRRLFADLGIDVEDYDDFYKEALEVVKTRDPSRLSELRDKSS